MSKVNLMDESIIEKFDSVESVKSDLIFKAKLNGKEVVYKAYLGAGFRPVFDVVVDGKDYYYNNDLDNKAKSFFLELGGAAWEFKEKEREAVNKEIEDWLDGVK